MVSTTVTPSIAPTTSPPAELRGLHGHSIDTALLPIVVAEALGTFLLVLTVLSAAIAATLSKPIAGIAYGSLTVPVAGGVALAVLVAILGPISGAHLNPAVTLSVVLERKLPFKRVLPYMLSQLVGAVVAALVAWWFYGPKARSVAYLGATQPAAGVDAWRVFGAEAIATFVLVIVIIGVGRASSNLAPVAIGSALAAAILIS